jgi:hypothetical protein
MKNKTSLDCCVCGCGAGNWEQHWNRDTGYGICPQCVSEEAARETPERLESLYGKVGVNYDQPMARFNGKRYRVLASTKREAVANAFMERTPGSCVLTVFDDKTIVIASKDDEGTPLPSQDFKLP